MPHGARPHEFQPPGLPPSLRSLRALQIAATLRSTILTFELGRSRRWQPADAADLAKNSWRDLGDQYRCQQTAVPSWVPLSNPRPLAPSLHNDAGSADEADPGNCSGFMPLSDGAGPSLCHGLFRPRTDQASAPSIAEEDTRTNL